MVKEIIIFRYGHRTIRDYRVSSHCSLVARAFGAKKIIICGEEDLKMKNSVDIVTKKWGGPFKIEFVPSWEKKLMKIKKSGFKLIHLTMYGENIQKTEKKIMNHSKICIIIGSQKVEREIYDISDYNIGITQQPHSEIAALAVFMDRIQKGKELSKIFKTAKKKIKPSKNSKIVINLK
jgi:tRNA (cytidine56-2'-O)-methyltransferase